MADANTLLSGANTYQVIADLLGVSVGAAMIILVIVSIWALVWKGLSLWKSAGKKHLIWFIALLIFNTVGILDILYIYVFSKMSLKGKARKAPPKKKK